MKLCSLTEPSYPLAERLRVTLQSKFLATLLTSPGYLKPRVPDTPGFAPDGVTYVEMHMYDDHPMGPHRPGQRTSWFSWILERFLSDDR